MMPQSKGDRMALLLIALLPLALMLPGIGDIPFPGADATYSDLAITHLPYAEVLRQAVAAGRFPLWNPLILSGAPFAANPLAGVWYPPGWLALLFPLPFGLNLVILLHLVWGGWGLFALLRSEGRSLPAALFGAAAWVWLPKLWAHYGAGHVTLLYALAWTPWLLRLSARDRAATIDQCASEDEDGGANLFHRIGVRYSHGEAVLLALIFTADPRWTVYAGILWVAYSVFRRGAALLGEMALRITGQAAVAGLLAAPLALPMLEYVRLSTRVAIDASDRMIFSLPPARLLGLLFPDWGGYHEYALYLGQITLTLALVAVVGSSHRSRRFWMGAVVLGLIWALGNSIPPVEYTAGLPGLSLLRVPSRALFIVGMAAACLAAYALDDLLEHQLTARQAARSRLTLVGLVAVSAALAAGAAWITGTLTANHVWGCGFLACSAAWVFWVLNGLARKPLWLVIGWLALGADLLLMDASLFQTRRLPDLLGENGAAAKALADEADTGRFYSPSYSVPQEAAARYRLELADGVDPLQLEAYAAFMESATGIPRQGYSVTLPPFASGGPDAPVDPARANAGYRPDPELLGLVNVGYVAAAYSLDMPGLELISQVGDVHLYRNLHARGPAWVQPEGDHSVRFDPILPYRRMPERIEVYARGPGILVLSEIDYPGWQVEVDDQPAEKVAVFGLLRGVCLADGEHRVVFVFRPLSIYIGLVLWLVGALIIALSACRLVGRGEGR